LPTSAAGSVARVTGALQTCYDRFEALCASFGETDWDAQSLCPEWNVREVVKHVTSIEAVMAGWLPEDDTTPPPFEKAAEFLEGTDDNAVLVKKVHTVYSQRRDDLSKLAEADLQRPSWMPVGPGSYGRFLAIRVFDFWVHERDITTPLGRATDDTGSTAEFALAEVEGSIGYIVGKKVGLPDGKSLAIRLTGPIERDINVRVDGRAKRVDHLQHPDATLTTDSTTFIQLACGRIDPQAQIDSGAVRFSGDHAIGERAARNLRFTM
jgi:uncharacterized protein (TIGR03083 family)